MTRNPEGLAYISKDDRIFRLDEEGLDKIRVEAQSVGRLLVKNNKLKLLASGKEETIKKAENPRSIYSALDVEIGTHEYWNAETLKAFCNGRGGNSALRHIGYLIERLGSSPLARESAELHRFAPSLSSRRVPVSPSFERRFAINFTDNMEDQTDFAREFSGIYIIIRTHGISEVSLAAMSVGRSYIGDIPRFETVRNTRQNSGVPKTVGGIIYRSKDLIYSIGRLADRADIRVAILNRYQRSHLTGIRLGLMPNEDQPFSCNIFVVKLGHDPNDRKLFEYVVSEFSGVHETEIAGNHIKSAINVAVAPKNFDIDEIFEKIKQ